MSGLLGVRVCATVAPLPLACDCEGEAVAAAVDRVLVVRLARLL